MCFAHTSPNVKKRCSSRLKRGGKDGYTLLTDPLDGVGESMHILARDNIHGAGFKRLITQSAYKFRLAPGTSLGNLTGGLVRNSRTKAA